MGGRWPGKVQQLGSATEDKCSVTEGLGERPDHVFIELEAAVKHPCVCIVCWTALTNEIINVLIAAAHRLGKHLWSLQWKDVAAHPRALCEHQSLKWGANVKTVVTCNQITWILMFKAVIVRKHQERFVVWLHDMYLCDCHWQKMATGPFHGPARCSSSSYEQAVVLHSKWSLSDVRATASLWLQPHCQTIARISHYF